MMQGVRSEMLSWFRSGWRRPLVLALVAVSLVAGSSLVARAADPATNLPWWCNQFPWLPSCNWPAPWLSVGTRSGAMVTYTGTETEETDKGLLVRAHVRVLNAGKESLDLRSLRFRLNQEGTDTVLKPEEVQLQRGSAGSPGQGDQGRAAQPGSALAPGEEVRGTVTFLIPPDLLKERSAWHFSADGQQLASITIIIDCTISSKGIHCKIIIRMD